jgi:hypothetical protein
VAEPVRDIWGADGASAALTDGSDMAVPLVVACEPSLVEPSFVEPSLVEPSLVEPSPAEPSQAASGSASSAPRTIALFMHLSTSSRNAGGPSVFRSHGGMGADSFILDIAKLNL